MFTAHQSAGFSCSQLWQRWIFTGFLLRCRASYCEIYNEALYDLLKFTKQQLQVSWTSPHAL